MSRSRDLSGTIRMMFRNNSYESCWSSHRRRSRIVSDENDNIRYMEIPICQEVFEIPIFAFEAFLKAVKEGKDTQSNAIAVMLNTIGKEPRYKTLDRYMRDVLLEGYRDSRLVKLEVKQGNDNLMYYGTMGAVFDKDFKPLAICSYQVKREVDVVTNPDEQEESITKYKFLNPILRVDPYAYLYKTTSMERFIVNKMINTCLEDGAFMPMDYDVDRHFVIPRDQAIKNYPVKIEIDECPFLIHQTDSPSISTNNQKLLQLAIDHIEELIQ